MSRLYEFRGTRYLLRELSDLSGVETNVIRARLRCGWTIEQALAIPTPKQRRAGVVFNFEGSKGTGAGSTLRETPNIGFVEKAENA